MKIQQSEMCSSGLFNCELDFIRQRHLFLERALFYDPPNKKGISRVVNPRLVHILHPNVAEYLRICTRGLMTDDDYRTFCDYLAQEHFDNELLGGRIEKVLKKQILKEIEIQKKEDSDD